MLDRLAAGLLYALNIRGATMDIFLLPDREIAVMKKRFIRSAAEPNVLSFPEPRRFPHPETRKRYLGEIYLNRDMLKKDPARTAPLLLHGILHLLHYDHKRPADAKKMERVEKKILDRYCAQLR